VIIGTAVAVLVGAGAAYASLNTYTASITGLKKGGTAAKPVPTGYTENLAAMNTTSGDRAGVLIDIKTEIFGLKADTKDFPSCSATEINTGPKFNGNCSPKALVATGTVNAEIGGCPAMGGVATACADPLAGGGVPCNPDLVVENGGGGTQWYFFTAPSPTACGGLKTGATAPYPGKVSYKGKNMIIDVPLPPDVSTEVATVPGLYGSLTKEMVKLVSQTTKVHGKTVHSLVSIACPANHKRAWSVSFTAVQPIAHAGPPITYTTAPPETITRSGSSPC
jgi:hypothetical protein